MQLPHLVYGLTRKEVCLCSAHCTAPRRPWWFLLVQKRLAPTTVIVGRILAKHNSLARLHPHMYRRTSAKSDTLYTHLPTEHESEFGKAILAK